MTARRLLALAPLLLAASPTPAADAIRPIATDDASKTAAAVVVEGSIPLAYTAQLFPLDDAGQVISPGQADRQSEAVLDHLQAVLVRGHSGLDRLVRVHVYAARNDVVPAFRAAFAKRSLGAARPAITYVVGPLRYPDALVAVDAIAAAPGEGRGGDIALLTPGSRVFVSGQAEAATEMSEATRKTLESLAATLDHLGLKKSDVVQLKAFLRPISSAADVEREVAAFLGMGNAPPLVLVAWESENSPIEIELVANGANRQGESAVEYVTPPGLKASPVFSRVAVVPDGPLIFVGGLYGPKEADGRAQTQAIFALLKDLLSQAGSDFRHLVKATYYVSDDDASRALNELRPDYFDPSRPPAASKAAVAGVGAEGRGLTLDMIAVPAPAGE